MPWKCMFTDEASMLGSPQTTALVEGVMEPLGTGVGRLLVTLITSVSPGFTCSVGDSPPLGVVKQYSVKPLVVLKVL